MRVPTMSAGTRSGVNWMRWKSQPMALASVLTARVLARPGTPSTRRWPRASRAISMRSSRLSWPTITRLTWYRTSSSEVAGGLLGRLRLGLGVIGPPSAAPLTEARAAYWFARFARSLGRCSCRAPGGGDGLGEADADEVFVARGICEAGHDSNHLTFRIEKGTAGVAWTHGGVELDEAVQRAAVGKRERAVEARDDACGQRVDQPERVADDERLVTDADAPAEHGRHDHTRRLVGVQHRGVVVGVRGLDGGGRLRAVGERHEDVAGALDDVEGGEDLALGVDDDARAQRGVVGVRCGAGLDDDELGADRVEDANARCRLVLEVVDRLVDGVPSDLVDVGLADRRLRRVVHGYPPEGGHDQRDHGRQADPPLAPPAAGRRGRGA